MAMAWTPLRGDFGDGFIKTEPLNECLRTNSEPRLKDRKTVEEFLASAEATATVDGIDDEAQMLIKMVRSMLAWADEIRESDAADMDQFRASGCAASEFVALMRRSSQPRPEKIELRLAEVLRQAESHGDPNPCQAQSP